MTHRPDESLAAESEMDDRPDLAEKLSELDILRQSLDAAKAKEKDTYDQLLRQAAEFQNFRRRNESRIGEARRAGKEEMLIQIIALADVLSQAESASRGATDVETLKKGLALVKQQLDKFLSDQGLVSIPSKGEKLDPTRHEAIARVVRPELEEGTIVDEIQRGYTLNGQVVRPARVSVAAANPESQQANMEEEHHG